MHTDHFALRYLVEKKDAKPRLIRRMLLLNEFDFKVKDRKVIENQGANWRMKLCKSWVKRLKLMIPSLMSMYWPLEMT